MRRELRHDDLVALAAAVSTAKGRRPIFKAIETLSADVIGHRLFTIMHFDSKHGELERVYTTLPAVYPVGGRKKKRDTAWSDHVLRDKQAFRANTLEAIGAAFEDSATIASLGLGSVLNIPILRTVGPHDAGCCIGTMNLLHEPGWYTTRDEAIGAQLGYWLAPALA